MKKRRLKPFVLPTLYVIIVSVLFISILFVGSKLNNSHTLNYDFVTSLFTKNIVPVINVEDEKISKPFDNENVVISKYFYDDKSDDTSKESSIIYYENTYMPNTGVLYSSDEQFEVLASLPGTVTNIKEDEILGKVIYVEYNTNVTLVYYSLESTDLKIGDEVLQKSVIGKSGSNKIENEKKYSLLMEVYINGNIVNPLDFFEMNIEDLNN